MGEARGVGGHGGRTSKGVTARALPAPMSVPEAGAVSDELLPELTRFMEAVPFGRINSDPSSESERPLDAMEVMMKELKMANVTAQELLDLSHSWQPKFFAEAALLPGAAKLINHLSKHSVPMSICTGSSEQAFDIKTTGKTEMLELFGKMQHVLKCGSDERVTKGKPDPQAYLGSR